MPRSIVHWDGDAFFASVEQAADKRLRGIPMAVGGGHRGIIASASYEARRYGIRAAMPTGQALRLCPDLVIVRGNYELYETFSNQIFGLCETLTPYIERASIDEGYLDCSPLGDPGVITDRVRKLSDEVTGWLKITISSGIASNRLVSAVASKLHKPAGFTVVPRGSEAAFMAPLPLDVLPGLGPKTVPVLHSLGAKTLADLGVLGAERLSVVLGRQTPDVLARARGEDDSPVISEKAEAKSLSHQETFEVDVEDRVWLERCLQRHLADLLRQLRTENKMARTLTVRLRYSDWEEQMVQQAIPEPGYLEEDFFPLLKLLIGKAWQRRVRLRLAGVKLSQIYPALLQTDLFRPQKDKLTTLAHVADRLQERYGKGILTRAHHILDETKERPKEKIRDLTKQRRPR